MKIALVGAECEENLALRYIRATLEKSGHLVSLIAFNAAGDWEEAARTLVASEAGLAGFSMVFTYRAAEFARLARRSRELGFRGLMVAGGHFAAFNAEALLRDEPAFDAVALGEGEAIMAELATHLNRLGEVRGLVWRDAVGVLHRNAPAAKPPDLDALPWPTRLEPPDTYLGLPVANMLASRGCSQACAFCSIAAWHKLCGGPRLRLRDPAAVAEELAGLYRRGYRLFNFHDDNFFLPDKRQNLRRFWRLRGELRARGVGRIAFAVKSRPDTVEEEMFAFLQEFGLFRVFLGIEAGTADSLQRLDRGHPVAANERALAIVRRLGLHACFNLLLLNPDSTLEDFRANVGFLRAHARNPLNFCRTEVYAGTPLAERLRQAGRLLGDYWGYDYRIRDERAQTVFELMCHGLAGRHYGDGCVQHLAMQVDFERQVLDHFWGCPAPLHRRAKEFVRRVNLNSCDHLETIAAAAAGLSSQAAREAFARDLARRVWRDDQRFMAEAARLVADIHRASQPVGQRAGRWSHDAAAFLASSLALLAGACSTSQTVVDLPPPPMLTPAERHKAVLGDMILPRIAELLPKAAALRVRIAFDEWGKSRLGEVFNTETGEVVPLPPETWQGFRELELRSTLCEATFSVEEVAVARTRSPGAITAPLRAAFGQELALALYGDLNRAVDVDLEVTVTKAGRIAAPRLWRVVPGPERVAVRMSSHTEDLLAQVRVAETNLRGRSFTLRYTAFELRRAIQRTHIFEMIPAPRVIPEPRNRLSMPPLPFPGERMPNR